ncbi:MAG: response regulator [Rhodospirillales bacterium]|nr:response regulator [Rhodospirillales bacterium]
MVKVLVVDDEELVRLTLRQMLESEGHDVLEARNGREAVAIQNKTPADIVLTDIIMPEQEGIETIIQLRRQDPNLRIIAISGGGRMKNLDFLRVAANVGADATLTKPFTTDELVEVIRGCMVD